MTKMREAFADEASYLTHLQNLAELERRRPEYKTPKQTAKTSEAVALWQKVKARERYRQRYHADIEHARMRDRQKRHARREHYNEIQRSTKRVCRERRREHYSMMDAIWRRENHDRILENKQRRRSDPGYRAKEQARESARYYTDPDYQAKRRAQWAAYEAKRKGAPDRHRTRREAQISRPGYMSREQKAENARQLQWRVLELYTQGLTCSQIAEQLDVGKTTVRRHLRSSNKLV